MGARMNRKFVGLRSNDNQSQRACPSASSPKYPHQLFVLDVAPTSPKVNSRCVPGDVRLLSDLFRSKSVGIIFTSRSAGRPAQSSVFSTSCNHIDAIQSSLKESAVAKAPIHYQSDASLGCPHPVQSGTKPADHLQAIGGKILLLDEVSFAPRCSACQAS
jgi:hypothetical protein